MQLEDKHYYPVDYKHNERMLGAVIGVRQLKATSTITLDATFSKHTQIAAKNELLNQLAWKNKK